MKRSFTAPKKTSSDFTVAIILTIKANSYQEALVEADNVGAWLSQDAGIGVQVIHDYERDNYENRVLYLGNEHGVVQECQDE